MSAWTNPRAAVVVVALGVTACGVAPSGSTQASLSGQGRQDAAGLPSAMASMTPTTASMRSAMAAQSSQRSAAASPGTSRPKSSGPSALSAPSSQAASRVKSPIPYAPSTGAAPSVGSTPSVPSTGAAPSTEAAPSTGAASSASSAPATSGSSNQALSVSRGCAAQLTVPTLQQFSCPFTMSGGTPDVSYAVDLFINGSLALEAGTLPAGLETTDTANDTVYTIEGKPEQWGTFAFTVTFYSGQTSASANFTLIVPQPPASSMMP